MGNVSLNSLEYYRENNRKNLERYQSNFNSCRNLKVVAAPLNQQSNHHYIIAELQDLPTNARDVVYQILHTEGVLARRYFFPGCHRMEPYRSQITSDEGKLIHTETLCQNVLCFPNGTSITETEVDGICELTMLILRHAAELGEFLSKTSFDMRS
jgi:dTDP-4-amino-4,6-dideoxygalactose transaminase